MRRARLKLRRTHYSKRQQFLDVRVGPGFIIIKTWPHGTDIIIPKKVLVPLLRWLIPLVRQMDQSFDPQAEIARSWGHLDEMHRLRRERRRSPKRSKRSRRRT